MKQITYNIDWLTIAGSIIATHDVEDGFWQLNIRTESMTGLMPIPVDGAFDAILPGHMVRITGFQLTKVPTLEFMSYEVKNGQIVEVGNGFNTDNSGPEQSSSPVGENSGHVGGDAPPADPRAGEINRRRSRKLRNRS